MEPLVSFLLPTHNRVDQIRKTIDSILFQSYKNIEIIITDNSSNLETENLIKSQYSFVSKIKYVKNESNIGPILNWKKAFEVSKGIYCVVIPDDDFLINTFFIEDVISILETTGIDIVFTSCILGYPKGNVIYAGGKQLGFIDGYTFLQGFWSTYNIYTIVNVFRRSAVDSFDFFYDNEILYSDIELWLKIIKNSKIQYYNIPSVYYTFHDANIVLNMDIDKMIQNSKFIISTLNYWKDKITKKQYSRLHSVLLFRYFIFISEINRVFNMHLLRKMLSFHHLSYSTFIYFNWNSIAKLIFKKIL